MKNALKQTLIWFCFLCLTFTVQGLFAQRLDNQPQNAMPQATGFVENKGQMFDDHGNPRPDITHRIGGKNLQLYLRKSTLSYVFNQYEKSASEADGALNSESGYDRVVQYRTDVELVGANPNPTVRNEGMLNGTFNYYQTHCPQGITGVRQYERVVYENVYPKIDLVFYAQKGGYKYDFVAHKGANLSQIKLRYSGSDDLKLQPNGDLVLTTPQGEIREKAPLVYQNINGVQKTVSAAFQVINRDLTYSLGQFDANIDLIIDPTVVWSAFIGGDGNESANDLKIGTNNTIALCGGSTSNNFPLVNNQSLSNKPIEDIAVCLLDNDGLLLFSALIGEAGVDRANGLAFDASQNLIVTGQTNSPSYPKTTGPFTTAFNNGATGTSGIFDVVLLKVKTDGTLLWSTAFGGSLNDVGKNIAIDKSGNFVVSGETSSADFPTTVNPYKNILTGSSDAFIAKFDTDGNPPFWMTFFGGNGTETIGKMAVNTNATGNSQIVITGETGSSDFPLVQNAFGDSAGTDMYVTVLASSGNLIGFSTYFGGSLDEAGLAARFDNQNNVIVAGYTKSANFPMLNAYHAAPYGGEDAIVAKFGGGGQLLWSTRIGGFSADRANAIAITTSNEVLVAGFSSSGDFPFVESYGSANAGSQDAFIARFTGSGGLVWSSVIGGGLSDVFNAIEVNSLNEYVVVGNSLSSTSSPVFPTTLNTSANAPLSSEMIVVKWRECKTTVPVTFSPAFPTICAGKNISVKISGGLNYKWAPAANVVFSSVNGDSVVLNAFQSTLFTITVSEAQGCAVTSTMQLVIDNSMTVVASASADSICQGATVQLIATGASNYVWQPGNITNDTITVVADGVTTYTVTGYDANGCSAIDSITIKGVGASQNIVANSDYSFACPGGTVNLYGSGGNIGAYLWMPGGFTQDTISVTPNGATTYTLTAIDPQGCTGTATVDISSQNTVVVNAVALNNNICPLDFVTLKASGAESYIWYPNLLSGDSIDVQLNQTATFTVYGSLANGCSASETVTITVSPTLNISVSQPDTTVCAGTLLTVAMSGASTYGWSPNVGVTIISADTVQILVDSTLTYVVSGNGGPTCSGLTQVTYTVSKPVLTLSSSRDSVCVGGNMTLSASGPFVSYSWTPALGLDVSQGDTVIATPTQTTTYTVTAIDAIGCTVIDSIVAKVGVGAPPFEVSPISADLCQNAGIVLKAKGGGQYTWLPTGGNANTDGSIYIVAPSQTTTYTVTGLFDANCTSTQTITVNVFDKPAVTASASNNGVVCPGGQATLSGSGAVTYFWEPNFGLSSNEGSTVVTTPIGTTTYTVTGYSGYGCFNTSTVTVTVQPPFITMNPTFARICEGSSANLTVSGASSYSWAPTTGLSQASGDTVLAAPNQTTTYTVTALSGCATNLTTTITVQVDPAPAPVIQMQGGLLSAGTFAHYQWIFNGTSLTNSDSPTLAILGDGQYQVLVTDGKGCSDTSAVFSINDVAESLNGSSVSLYPNPASGSFTLDFNNLTDNRLTIQLFDLTGRLALEKLVTANAANFNQTIEVGSLSAGTYLVKITNGGSVIHKKLTVNR